WTKGEGYLFSLLQIVPTITLLDMYISDAVESIFTNVRQRYVNMSKEIDDNESAAQPAPARAEAKPAQAKPAPAAPARPVDPAPKPSEKAAKAKTSTGKWVAWTAAGAAAA